MKKEEEFFKNQDLLKKYSNKPFPRALKYIGKINKFEDFESWIKETNKALLNWIIDYLIILPFLFYFCLSAVDIFNTPYVLNGFLTAVGISLAWYLLISLIKDIRGVFKNG